MFGVEAERPRLAGCVPLHPDSSEALSGYSGPYPDSGPRDAQHFGLLVLDLPICDDGPITSSHHLPAPMVFPWTALMLKQPFLKSVSEASLSSVLSL